MSRRSSELFFLRTVRVCPSVGLGGAEPSSPVGVLGKGVMFVACRTASGSGARERESGGGAESDGAAISTSTFVSVVNINHSSGLVYGSTKARRIGGIGEV